MREGSKRMLLTASTVIVIIIVTAALWASTDPDGLERVAEDLGFADAGEEPGYQLLPDYTVPGLDGLASTVAAGLIGVIIVATLLFLLGRLLTRRRA